MRTCAWRLCLCTTGSHRTGPHPGPLQFRSHRVHPRADRALGQRIVGVLFYRQLGGLPGPLLLKLLLLLASADGVQSGGGGGGTGTEGKGGRLLHRAYLSTLRRPETGRASGKQASTVLPDCALWCVGKAVGRPHSQRCRLHYVLQRDRQPSRGSRTCDSVRSTPSRRLEHSPMVTLLCCRLMV